MNKETYKNLYNEGSEGFNPYEPEPTPLTDEEMASKILRIMEGTSTADPRYAELKAEYNTLIAKSEAETTRTFANEWTLETTLTRREQWNAWVREHKGTISFQEITVREQKQGFTVANLKKAASLHNIK